MKKILIFTLIIFFLPFISASQINSSNYQIDSVFSSGGDNISSSNYKIDTILGLIVGNTNSSLYQQSLGFFFCTPDTCASLGYICDSWSDGCGSTLDCSTCASGYTCTAGTCTVVSAGEPSGGGLSGITCTYDWVCSEWYPEPCPANGIQKRVCVNKGTCTGTAGMPKLNRTCVSEIISPAEPLFDMHAKIPLEKKWIIPGESLKVNIELINLGNTTPLDVSFKYWIVNENNTLIAEMQETRAISEQSKFQIEILLSPEIKLGLYKFYAQITYDLDKVAVAEDSFEIVKSKIEKFALMISLILITLLTIILLIFLIIKWRKKKHKKKKRIKSFKNIFRKKKTETSLKKYKKRIRKTIERHKNKNNYNK